MNIDDLRSDYDCEELRLCAAYRQFYVQDSAPNGDICDSFWSKRAVDDLLAVGDGIIGVGTKSFDFVRVFVKTYQQVPETELSNWDHVTEAGLDVASGRLLVFGCVSTSGLFFDLEEGHYRVRCSHANLAEEADCASGEDDLEGSDWYFVQAWPSDRSPMAVLKRWSGA